MHRARVAFALAGIAGIGTLVKDLVMQVIAGGGRLCGCGRYGCLETEASRLAIAAEAAKAAYRGEAPHLMKIAGTNLAEIRSGQLAEAVREGDKAIEQIVARAAGYLGAAVGDLANLLLPDTVVLGGGLVEAMASSGICISGPATTTKLRPASTAMPAC